jgi:hypothetical protein
LKDGVCKFLIFLFHIFSENPLFLANFPLFFQVAFHRANYEREITTKVAQNFCRFTLPLSRKETTKTATDEFVLAKEELTGCFAHIKN